MIYLACLLLNNRLRRVGDIKFIAWFEGFFPSGNTCWVGLSVSLGAWSTPRKEYQRDQAHFSDGYMHEYRFVDEPPLYLLDFMPYLTLLHVG